MPAALQQEEAYDEKSVMQAIAFGLSEDAHASHGAWQLEERKPSANLICSSEHTAQASTRAYMQQRRSDSQPVPGLLLSRPRHDKVCTHLSYPEKIGQGVLCLEFVF